MNDASESNSDAVGVSYAWSGSVTTDPDLLVDAPMNPGVHDVPTPTPPQPSGLRYLHARAVDAGGNLGPTVDLGPFRIRRSVTLALRQMSGSTLRACGAKVAQACLWKAGGSVSLRVRDLGGSRLTGRTVTLRFERVAPGGVWQLRAVRTAALPASGVVDVADSRLARGTWRVRASTATTSTLEPGMSPRSCGVVT